MARSLPDHSQSGPPDRSDPTTFTTEKALPRRSKVVWSVVLVAIAAGVSLLMTGLGGLLGSGNASAVVAAGKIVNWGPEVRHVEGTQNGNSLAAITEIASLQLADNSVVRAYCIDLNTATDTTKDYVESNWATVNPVATAKILWILQHGYPTVSASALAAAAGTTLSVGVKDSRGIDEGDNSAMAATQAAIWAFSNNFAYTGVTAPEPDGTPIGKITQYLIANATAQPEPPPSLTVLPSNGTGPSGTLIGPFTVTTTATTPLALSLVGAPAGSEIVDGSGNPISTAVNGGTFYVRVPAGTMSGSAKVKIEGTVVVPVGRVFSNAFGAQLLIAAVPTPTVLIEEVTVDWSTTTTTTSTTTTKPEVTTTTTKPEVTTTKPEVTTTKPEVTTTTTKPEVTTTSTTKPEVTTTSTTKPEVTTTSTTTTAPTVPPIVIIVTIPVTSTPATTVPATTVPAATTLPATTPPTTAPATTAPAVTAPPATTPSSKTGCLGDYVWNDKNGDGRQDSGEPGLANVTVTIADATTGAIIQALTTDSSGRYLVCGLPAGTYRVTVTPPPALNFKPTYDLDGRDTPNVAVAALAAGQTRDDVDFGYTKGKVLGKDFEETITGSNSGTYTGIAVLLLLIGAGLVLIMNRRKGVHSVKRND